MVNEKKTKTALEMDWKHRAAEQDNVTGAALTGHLEANQRDDDPQKPGVRETRAASHSESYSVMGTRVDPPSTCPPVHPSVRPAHPTVFVQG